MNERGRRLALEPAPGLGAEDALDLGLIGQWVEKSEDEPQPDLAAIGNQFERRYVHVLDADLAIADHPVAGVLEAGDAEIGDAH